MPDSLKEAQELQQLFQSANTFSSADVDRLHRLQQGMANMILGKLACILDELIAPTTPSSWTVAVRKLEEALEGARDAQTATRAYRDWMDRLDLQDRERRAQEASSRA